MLCTNTYIRYVHCMRSQPTTTTSIDSQRSSTKSPSCLALVAELFVDDHDLQSSLAESMERVEDGNGYWSHCQARLIFILWRSRAMTYEDHDHSSQFIYRSSQFLEREQNLLKGYVTLSVTSWQRRRIHRRLKIVSTNTHSYPIMQRAAPREVVQRALW